MPTNRRRRAASIRPAYEELDLSLEYELLHGEPLINGAGFPDEDAMRSAWEMHGERLLAEWIEEHPGTRPFAWWLFVGVPSYGERPIVDERFGSMYVRENFLRWGILHTRTLPPVQEPEREFLARHGELTAAEIALG